MADGSPLGAVVVGAVAVLVGYLVKYRGWHALIAGNELLGSVAGTRTVANVVGNVAFVAGTCVLLYAALGFAGVAHRIPEWAFGLAAVAAVVLIAPRLPYRADVP